MPSKVLIIDSDAATTNWLQTRLVAEGYLVETAHRGDLGLKKIAASAPNVVVLDLTLADMGGLEIIRTIRENPLCVDIAIIVLTTRSDPDDIVASLNAGADHYIRKRPGADAELAAKIQVSLNQPKKGPSAATRGKIISFCSAKGGTGTTSVCVNTAYALAKSDPKAQIVLVDMVFPIGSVGSSLGYESHKTVARLSNEAKGKIDRVSVERYVSQKLKWGFHVVLGANDPNEATGIDVSQIRPIFEMLRNSYDYILIDFGRALSRISMPILEISSAIVIIVTPDTNTVKATKQILQYLESHDIELERIVLINNRTVGRVWTTTDDIERELKIPLAATVPFVVEYMTMAINATVPFMEKFPENSACYTFEEIAKLVRERIKRKN